MKKAALRILFFSLIIVTGLGLGCCKKPDNKSNNNGTLVLKFHITGGGQPFALNHAILNTTGQRYYFTVLAFYASNVTLTGNDSQLLSSILLIDTYPSDIINNPAQVDTTFTFNNVTPGTYTGLKFGIGPDAQQNQQGGGSYAYTNYPSNSPLGDYYAQSGNQFYWGTSLGYLFFLAQGDYDPSANNTGSINQQFAYHCGTDSDFSTKTFTSPIQITAGATTTFTINLETNDIFNAPNVINLKKSNDESTHTTDNPLLAKELLQNLNAALKTN